MVGEEEEEHSAALHVVGEVVEVVQALAVDERHDAAVLHVVAHAQANVVACRGGKLAGSKEEGSVKDRAVERSSDPVKGAEKAHSASKSIISVVVGRN
jgi:hypothetical protein